MYCRFFRDRKNQSVRYNTPWYRSKLALKDIILMLFEFSKGNMNQSIKIAQDLGVTHKTVVEHRKKFREILVKYNIGSQVDLGNKIVFDETQTTGFKKKKGPGRSHGPSTWTYVVANKEPKDRRVKLYNTQIRNGETLAPLFMDAIKSTTEPISSKYFRKKKLLLTYNLF